MNKAYCLLIIVLISVYTVNHAQDINYSNVDSLIIEKGKSARKHWEYGRFEEAEQISKDILKLKLEYYSAKPSKVINNYRNLGTMYYNLARYDEAFEMFEKVLAIFVESENNSDRAGVLVMMGTIFHLRMDYSKALQYYFNSIRLMEESPSPDNLQLAACYTNIGIVYFTMEQIDKATEYFSIAFELAKGDISYYESILGKHSQNLVENNMPDAGKYLQLRSDLLSKIDSKTNHIQYKIDFAEYAFKMLKKPDIAIENLNKALQLSLAINEVKKPNLHDIYFDLAEIHFSQKKYLISLNYIQQLFQYCFRDFKSFNYIDNPVLRNGNFRIVILDALALKSKVMYNMYLESGKLEYLDAGVSTILHAIDAINQVRLRINSEESKFLISKNQLNTFKLAQEIIYEKYRLTNDVKYKDLSFEVIEMGRNFSLLSSLRSIKAIEYGDIPAELLKREGELNQKISFYNEKVLNEKGLDIPNENYIKVWETYIFDLTREYDDLIAYFEKEYKGYYNLKYDTKVISMNEVSAKLSEDDLVIEYSLMDTLLFTYIISQDETRIFKQKIDTSFSSKCLRFYQILTKQNFSYGVKETFNNYAQHGYDIYKVLLEPYEEYIKDKNLIFIPDGAISFVPFDALLTEEVDKTEPNYYNLPYLIRQNAVSTSYSSTIHFNDLVNHKKTNGKVLAFAPDYANLTAHNPGYNFLRQDDRDKLIRIPGVQEEVTKISGLTSTKMMKDRDASETNFKNIAPEFGILHLAMHTILDDEDPLYSKLAFTQFVDSINDGFLYTYEIYNMKLSANLAVLSSCGSGFGNFREGEGIQSMARSFAYAGCPSILMTLWEVADLSTVSVMERFYYHLKRGKSKSKALQLSKLEFLKNADQLRSNPFFWSSYTIVGNSEPIFSYFPWSLILKIAILLLPVPIIFLFIRSYRRQAQKNFF